MQLIDQAWAAASRVRQRAPLVHNITNYVAMDVSANVLLAAGASPAMVHAEDEAAAFAEIADAVVVNIGTLSAPWVRAMHAALQVARASGKPSVLDPVGVGATDYRTQTARTLLERHRPSVVRGNASEILALAGAATTTKGVDSTRSAEDAVGAARAMAGAFGVIVVVTGAVDRATDGERVVRVENGHPLMTRVTALGCSLSGLIGAYLAVEPDPLVAATSALAVFGVAGELAAEAAKGPGSLRTALIDTLATLDRSTFERLAVIREA